MEDSATSITDSLTYFTPCSSMSIVNFEQVIVGWEKVTSHLVLMH